MKTLNDYKNGEKIDIIPSRFHNDGIQGEYFVVGALAPADLKVARNPEDPWEAIVHLSRVEGSGW